MDFLAAPVVGRRFVLVEDLRFVLAAVDRLVDFLVVPFAGRRFVLAEDLRLADFLADFVQPAGLGPAVLDDRLGSVLRCCPTFR